MKAVELIKSHVELTRMNYLSNIEKVDAKTAQWVPPGNPNCIGMLMLHVANAEDGIVNQMLQGKQTVWDSGGWEEKVKAPFNFLQQVGQRGMKVDPKLLVPYRDAVFASTDAYIKTLDDPALDRIVETPIGKFTVGIVLDALVVGHMASIVGEIAVLKGLQGLQGYVTGADI